MKRFKYLFGPPGEQGSIAPIVALGLMAFIGFLALGIDLGQLYVVKNELQNVADGAALAAAKQLVREDPTTKVATIYVGDAKTAAVACALNNHSMGVADGIKVNQSDVIVGQWNLATKAFTTTSLTDGPAPTGSTNFAVQVTVRRTGSDTNPQVTTFLGGVIGAGSQKDVEATAVAFLDNAGTSSIGPPIAVPPVWTSGDGLLSSNGLNRILEKIGPAPAYAALPKTYKFYDYGGSKNGGNLDTRRATFVVPTSGDLSLTALQKYIKGPDTTGGLPFPQKKVGEKLYPMSELNWGSNIKSNTNLLKTRFNAKKDASGKWRVTLPVYAVDPVTAAAPQDSWFKLASRLLPGVPQAHACAAYTSPAVYTQGFITVDITDVYVQSDCTTGDQSLSTSCRNTCYVEMKPVNENTVSGDKGSNPTPFPKDYQEMNPPASKVGVFAATPRIVK